MLRPMKSVKFVDDNVNVGNVSMKECRLLEQNGNLVCETNDLRTQELLAHVAKNAENKGMKIIAAKTGLMCISAAQAITPRHRSSYRE